MDWLFFIRCIETAVAILGMTLSIAEFNQNLKWRLEVSALIIFVSCIFFTLIYTHLGILISEKIYIPVILVVFGYLINKNSADCYFINLFNFLTQLVIYFGVSMLSTFMVRTTFSISYLVIRL